LGVFSDIMSVGHNQRPHVSFVVPCYNEAAHIADTVAEIEAAAAESDTPSYEIVVVDDCSRDQSAAIVTTLMTTKTHLRLVRNSENLGFGGAYKEGVRHAEGHYAIMVPGDNAHPRDSLTPILRKAGDADIIIPHVTNMHTRSRRRQMASHGFTWTVNLLFGLDVPYFNGTVLHKTDLLKSIEIKTDGFAYQAEALVKLIRRGASFSSVGIAIDESRAKRMSAFRPKNVYRVLRAIAALWFDERRRVQPIQSSIPVQRAHKV